MKVCYFGIYNPEYSRNKILISGLKKNGVDVLECRTDKKGILKYFDLINKYIDIKNDYEVMIVGFPGQQAMILARILTKKPIVLDAFISLYDSMVLDRKLTGIKSLRAYYYWWLDKLSMGLADLILFDTNKHIEYASREFNIDSNKFIRIFLGANTNIFYPQKNSLKNRSTFKILFYGTYIPLHGIEFIIKAAKLLEVERDILFEIIGNGQEKNKILNLIHSLNLNNIVLSDNISTKELTKKISDADICLGIFGETDKAERVIPNKIFECIAMKKPVITADTPAIRELFDSSDLFLVKRADAQSIADAVIVLKNNYNLMKKISENAYEKTSKMTSINIISRQLIKEIDEL